jgi:hypothetical protein
MARAPFVARLVALAIGATGSTVRAQQPPPAPPAAVADAAMPAAPPRVFERPNGALLRGGVFRYALTLTRNGVATPLGIRTVEVTEATLGGVPGWLIAESRTGTVVPTTDSLWLARADLTPERWVATIGSAGMGASFTRDSVFGALQSYQGRSSFAAAVPPGALITPGMVDRLVEMLPLRVGYRATASLLSLDYGTPRAAAADIVVEREERVRLGSREVDCWVVTLRSGAMEERRWVTKDALRVVRFERVMVEGVLAGVEY